MTSALYDSYKIDVANKEMIQVIHNQKVLEEDFKVYGDLENPIFLAKDVAGWIEHNQVARMIELVDADEKLKCLVSTSGQSREMWFLTEDGLYEVLMQSRKPIAKQFKKKVKQLLKDLRLNKFNPYSNMSKELQAIFMLDSKQQELENKVSNIESKMTVDYELAENLRTSVNSRAVHLLGNKHSEAYKRLSKKLFAEFYRDIKGAFKVNSYKNISLKNYEKALHYIEHWKPSEMLGLAIHGANSQIKFN